ncbi:PhzF family phenazine biosynthesis protein [Bacteroidota bacterium]
MTKKHMNIPIYQVDAFSDTPFGGNPAAVCILDSWLADDVMQKIGQENNLSETAFIVRKSNAEYEIRWFTPSTEINLCGHATLASAYVVFHFIDKNIDKVSFNSKSGVLSVDKNDDILTLDFPSTPPKEDEVPLVLIKALGVIPEAAFSSRDLLVVVKDEETVRSLNPDFNLLKELDYIGIIVTAKGDNSDFVSRFFAPNVGINEDPVTGSAHTTLIPFWAEKLNKSILHAYQVSSRKGELWCELKGDRVKIAGKACLILQGELTINN